MNNIAKLFLFLIIIPLNINAQDNTKINTIYEPFISVSYMSVNPNLTQDFYAVIRNRYIKRGVNIPVNFDFDKSLSVTIGYYFSEIKNLSVGFGLGYSNCSVTSNYQDQYGKLKISGLNEAYKILLIANGAITRIFELPLILFLDASISYSVSSLNQSMRLNNYIDYNFDEKWNFYTWGPSLQASVGTKVEIKNFLISPRFGYQAGLIYVPADRIFDIHNAYSTDKNISRNVGQSGIIFIVDFGMKI